MSELAYRGPRRTASGLILPPSVQERRVVSRCSIPTGPPDSGEFCGQVFYEDEPAGRAEAHAVQCASANHDHIVALRQRRHPDVMKPWDPEHYGWIRRNGEAVLEGRLKP